MDRPIGPRPQTLGVLSLKGEEILRLCRRIRTIRNKTRVVIPSVQGLSALQLGGGESKDLRLFFNEHLGHHNRCLTGWFCTIESVVSQVSKTRPGAASIGTTSNGQRTGRKYK